MEPHPCTNAGNLPAVHLELCACRWAPHSALHKAYVLHKCCEAHHECERMEISLSDQRSFMANQSNNQEKDEDTSRERDQRMCLLSIPCFNVVVSYWTRWGASCIHQGALHTAVNAVFMFFMVISFNNIYAFWCVVLKAGNGFQKKLLPTHPPIPELKKRLVFLLSETLSGTTAKFCVLIIKCYSSMQRYPIKFIKHYFNFELLHACIKILLTELLFKSTASQSPWCDWRLGLVF